jgi:hypothetical protein
MLSYQGKPEIKAEFAARFAAHRKMDEVIQEPALTAHAAASSVAQ